MTRAKSNLKARRRYSHTVDRNSGLICDQTIACDWLLKRQDFEAPLRRIRFEIDPKTGKRLVFLTIQRHAAGNHYHRALSNAGGRSSCSSRWIKQHLRIKVFFGTLRERSVKSSSVDCCLHLPLVAIVKKRLHISVPLV